jgi:hypothetical protein
MYSSSVSEKKRKRERARGKERKNGEKSLRKCECVRAHTTYTHRIGKKKREKGAVARSLARLSCAIHFCEQARKHKWPCMYHDGMRDVTWKRKVGREGERGRAREVKNIESERGSEQTIMSFGVSYLLLLLITNSTQY